MKKEEYRRLVEDFQSVFDSISDGIYVTDGEGRTIQVNRAFEEICEIPSSTVLNQNVNDLIRDGIYNQSVTIPVLKQRREVSMVR